MNKAAIDAYIPYAYDAINEVKIVGDDGTVNKAFRGQISTFGAAITMGSPVSAIAFFSDRGGAAVDRTLILKAIIKILAKATKKKEANSGISVLLNYDKEEIINAAIALKLAMNLYRLEEKERK